MAADDDRPILEGLELDVADAARGAPVVIPVLNDAATLASLLPALPALEIIVVFCARRR